MRNPKSLKMIDLLSDKGICYNNNNNNDNNKITPFFLRVWLNEQDNATR
jgi:hypothetical protein